MHLWCFLFMVWGQWKESFLKKWEPNVWGWRMWWLLYPAETVERKDHSSTIILEHKPHICWQRQEQNLHGDLHWEINSRRGSQTCQYYHSLYSDWVSHQDSKTLICVTLSTQSKQIPSTTDGGSCTSSKEHLLLPAAVWRKVLKRTELPVWGWSTD